jgi:hypothetical protein
MPAFIRREDNKIEDDDLQEVTLYNGIPDQDNPESIAEYLRTA